MFDMTIALAQMEVVPGRPVVNMQTMLRLLGEARRAGAALVVFPEMAIPGYLLGDLWEQPAFLRDCEACGQEIAAASHGICVVFGNVAVDWHKRGNDGRERKYNTCFIAQDGEWRGGDNFPYAFRIKTLQPNYREFDDTRHFFSLRKLAEELGQPTERLLQPVNLVIDGRPLRLGCMLCEDGWSDDYNVKPIAILARQGADLLVNISSSPFTLGKDDKRHRVFAAQTRAAGVPLIYVNNVGLQNNGKTVYTFDGASAVYDAGGRVLTACRSFQEQMLPVNFGTAPPGPSASAGAKPAGNDIATIHKALDYGIRKFLAAIDMYKVAVAVSGGIDSAVAACLYQEVLGAENVLLVNMPSRFNSGTTQELAARLARNLQALYTVVPIQAAVDLTVRQVTESPITDLASGRRFSLPVSSFVAENIQARDRFARVLAALAAAFGGGFTCNANKSELTVGYTTLYGDQAGFLAALADLWKHQIYALAEYINARAGRELIPRGSMEIVPSAELSGEQDVDQGKGDPLVYPYHDYLFRSWVERWAKATPEDILEWYLAGTLAANIGCAPGLPERLFPTPAIFIADLERWWRQYTGMGVAKRIQAPPVLAVSRRAFGFDHREPQVGTYYTSRYLQLRARALSL